MSSQLGWDGPEIPLEMQAFTLMKYYRKAVALCAANLTSLYHRVEETVGKAEEIGEVTKALENDNVYMRLLGKLAMNHDLYTDQSFRLSGPELEAEVVDEMDDMITWMAFTLWVRDGATFPDWMLEAHGLPVDDGDEEE